MILPINLILACSRLDLIEEMSALFDFSQLTIFIIPSVFEPKIAASVTSPSGGESMKM